MKQIFTFSIIALCCSCNTFQYIRVSSPDIPQNKQRQFETENDTMKLVYDFNGLSGPMKITVYNKLDKPLQMDLNRSVMIVNNNAIGLNSGSVEVSGSISATSTGGGTSTASGSVSASTVLPQGIVFIPPGTFISRSTLPVVAKTFDRIPAGEFLEENDNADTSSRMLKTAHFNRESSPLAFSTLLTFVQPDAPQTTITRQHSFYVSEIKQTTVNPYHLDYAKRAEGDELYISKPNKSAFTAGGIATLAVLVLLGFIIGNNAHPMSH